MPNDGLSPMELFASDEERETRRGRFDLFRACPVPGEDLLNNLGLFLNSKNLSRLLFFDRLYRMIADVQGVAIEFGTRWGQNLALLAALRGIYEPFNRHRLILGFDTFQGLKGVSEHDRREGDFHEGGLSVTAGYEEYLEKIMAAQEADNPLGHLKKFEIIKGDAAETFARYLESHPETIVALAWFDMDIYKPTVECLRLLKDRLVRGSVLGFDELNDPLTPGETVALKEVFGLNNIRLKRDRYAARVSYFVVE